MLPERASCCGGLFAGGPDSTSSPATTLYLPPLLIAYCHDWHLKSVETLGPRALGGM
jgi:hypothetical protein